MINQEKRNSDEALSRIEVCRRTRSTILDLSGLGLTTLPSAIWQLTGLVSLGIQNNRLATLPPEIGALRALERFEFYGNVLNSLPPEIGLLTNLKLLNGFNNKLTTLPREIGHLSRLNFLNIHSNQLFELPPEIGALRSLEELFLFRNQITYLPPEIGLLQKLGKLYIQDNQLAELPREIGHLSALRTLLLHGNPALDLPAELLGPIWDDLFEKKALPASPRAVLDYYFARQLQGEAPMQEVRVLMVGRGRVGKTSLLNALRGAQANAHEPETPGITVLPLDLKCARGTARGHAWDFGGQEFLHGTHQIFLSERCVYVLVLEGREGSWELETDYWLRFIQSYGGDSPVIVALNKYDAHAFSVDRYRMQERCPQISGFVDTDAFTGRGVEELRRLLERAVNGMEHVWVGVPRKWHRVKEELATTRESFIEYKDYQALCVRQGVTEERQQESLAETLHRLGIALNFRDHHRLKYTSVLKPQWVTEGIYGLLRHAQRQDCHGVLERSWIAQALPAKDYPAAKQSFVMELMEKFEVAFALEQPEATAGQPKEPRRWLIPELLPEVQPAAFAEFRQPGVKRLRFSYPEALPPGLLPRLIVRTHELSEARAEWRWRSGVVLEWIGARALVRLDRNERRTEVAVTGDVAEDCQSLFDIIRAHLTVLHDKVPVIEEVQTHDDPEKWVPMTDLRVAEREQEPTLPVTVGTGPEAKRVKLPVAETLNTVESEAARKAAGPEAEPRMQLFISYAHLNEKELIPFRPHLTQLSQQGYIQVWNDRDLVPGEQWEAGITDALQRADIVLLFYTTAARVSDFIQQTELPTALARSDAKQCTMLWVPLERNDLDPKHTLEQRLKKLQCATRDARPVYDFEIVQKGWMEVEQAIRRAVEARRKVVG